MKLQQTVVRTSFTLIFQICALHCVIKSCKYIWLNFKKIFKLTYAGDGPKKFVGRKFYFVKFEHFTTDNLTFEKNELLMWRSDLAKRKQEDKL